MHPAYRLNYDQIPATSGRIPGLDGLRALSILIVILGHFFLPNTGGVAALGVYVFFAISGFLITRLLFLENKKTGSVSAKNFYSRRFFRLYPVLLFYLVVIAGINLLHGDKNQPSEIFSVLFYYINYLSGYRILHNEPLVMQVGVLWSLSIEEHFYLIVPLFFIAVKGRPRPLFWFASLACVIPLILRCLYVYLWPEIIGKLITYRNSETRFDSIAVGVMLAILCETKVREKVVRVLSSRTAFALAGLTVFVSVLIKNDLFKETLRFSLISLSCVPLICGIVFGKHLSLFQRIANLPLFVWIGKLSYSLYVWHGFAAYFLVLLGYQHTYPGFGTAGVAVTFALASCSYYLVETPFLRLRAHFARASKIEPTVPATS